MSFKMGDRVIYVSGHWVTGSTNPLIGTSYFCEGTIVAINCSYNYRVKWDNGTRNIYYESDLELANPRKEPDWRI